MKKEQAKKMMSDEEFQRYQKLILKMSKEEEKLR